MNTSARRFIKTILLTSTILGYSVHAADSPPAPADTAPSLEKSITLGPLKLVGGIADGQLASSLTGGYAQKLLPIDGLSKCKNDSLGVESFCSLGQIDLNASVDATAGYGMDHAVVNLQPTFEYEALHRGSASSSRYDPSHPECADAGSPKYLESAYCMEGLDTSDSYGIVAVGVYPDLAYRGGEIEQDGAHYHANQFVYGGGMRLLYPALGSQFWATWPYISVAYDAVHAYGDNDAPDPDNVKDRYLSLEAQVEIYIPRTAKLFNAGTDSILFAKHTESHAPGESWESSTMVQLIMDVGGTLKPAITYQSGSDKGLSYDKQLLVGVVYSFFDRPKAMSD